MAADGIEKAWRKNQGRTKKTETAIQGCGRPGLPSARAKMCIRDSIQTAYIVFANGEFHPLSQVPISGGSPWIKSDRYQITAKVEDTPRRQIMICLLYTSRCV